MYTYFRITFCLFYFMPDYFSKNKIVIIVEQSNILKNIDTILINDFVFALYIYICGLKQTFVLPMQYVFTIIQLSTYLFDIVKDVYNLIISLCDLI